MPENPFREALNALRACYYSGMALQKSCEDESNARESLIALCAQIAKEYKVLAPEEQCQRS